MGEQLGDTAGRLNEAADGARKPSDADAQQRLEAMIAAGERLGWLDGRVSWEIVPPAWAEEVPATFNGPIEAIRAYRAEDNPDADLNVQWNEITNAWAVIGRFMPLVIPEDSVSEDAERFRRSAGQHVRRLSEEVAAAEAEVEQLSQRREEVAAQLESLKQESDEHVRALAARIEQQTERLEESLRTNQEQFSSAQDTHGRTFDEAMGEFRSALQASLEGAREQSQQVVQAAEAESREVLERIEDLEARATESYNVIGKAGAAKHFQQDADMEQKQARMWRWLAVVAFGLLAAGTLIELWKNDGVIEWEQTRSRIFIAIALLGFAGFAGAEARSHRKAERLSRDREMKLSSIDAYLVLADDKAKAEEVKLAYASSLFIDPFEPDEEPEKLPTPGTDGA